MITDLNQRWRDRRGTYRPAGEVIRTSDYDVAPALHKPIKDFVLRHHYSSRYPAARRRFGLYRRGELVGAAVFSHPCRNDVLTGVLPGSHTDSMELGRLVLLDDVQANGESWFVARCFDLLRREGVVGIVSFSDPVERRRTDGSVIFPGHVGCLYQALNAVYLGRGKPRILRIFPDGVVLSDRTISKIRSQEKGWLGGVRLLEQYGAEPLAGIQARKQDWSPREIVAPTVIAADPREWLKVWVPRITTPLRHTGNHKYVFALDRHAKKGLPASLPYPKKMFEVRSA